LGDLKAIRGVKKEGDDIKYGKRLDRCILKIIE